MQLSYSALKYKSVINVSDGNNLGRVTDILFTFPEGEIVSFLVGERKFLSGKDKLKIDLCCVKKIGKDSILVCLRSVDEVDFKEDYDEDFDEEK